MNKLAVFLLTSRDLHNFYHRKEFFVQEPTAERTRDLQVMLDSSTNRTCFDVASLRTSIDVNEPTKRFDRKGFSMSMRSVVVFIDDNELLNDNRLLMVVNISFMQSTQARAPIDHSHSKQFRLIGIQGCKESHSLFNRPQTAPSVHFAYFYTAKCVIKKTQLDSV